MNKLKKTIILLTVAMGWMQIAQAQTRFDERMPALIERGYLVPADLSVEQQEAFGIESARKRLERRLSYKKAPQWKINREAGSLTAAIMGVAREEDLNFERFQNVIRPEGNSHKRAKAAIKAAKLIDEEEFLRIRDLEIENARPKPPASNGPLILAEVRDQALEAGINRSLAVLIARLATGDEDPRLTNIINLLISRESDEDQASIRGFITSLGLTV